MKLYIQSGSYGTCCFPQFTLYLPISIQSPSTTPLLCIVRSVSFIQDVGGHPLFLLSLGTSIRVLFGQCSSLILITCLYQCSCLPSILPVMDSLISARFSQKWSYNVINNLNSMFTYDNCKVKQQDNGQATNNIYVCYCLHVCVCVICSQHVSLLSKFQNFTPLLSVITLLLGQISFAHLIPFC